MIFWNMTRIYFLFLCFFGILMVGCSHTNIPLAKSPKLYVQDKLQAVDHWDTIADAVANRVQKTLEDRPDLLVKSIFIDAPNNGIFVKTFSSLLRSRIVSKGMIVAEQFEPGSIILSFNVQTVEFDSSREDYGISLAGLGIGIGGLVVGGYSSPSNHEVVINTTMAVDNRYAMSLSQICYINDDDWMLYFNPKSLHVQGVSADAEWQRYVKRTPAFRSNHISASMPKNNPVINISSQQPIIEEYVMPAGGVRINPSAQPRSFSKKRR